MLVSSSVESQDMPIPPCSGQLINYGNIGSPPKVSVWTGSKDLRKWAPNDCIGWDSNNLLVAIETTGKFFHEESIDDIIIKFGRISEFKEILYWSHTRNTWRELIPDAFAINDISLNEKRIDFSLEELRSNSKLYYWQRENTPVGEVIYEMTIAIHSKNKIEVRIQNATTIKRRRIKLLNPGEYQFLYIIERDVENLWNYYSLMRSAAPSNPLINLVWPLLTDGNNSYINRTVSQFRFLSGLPTDKEPPAAP